MSEHFEHNVGDHEDPVPSSTWLVGVLGAALLIIIVFGLTALYYNAQASESDVKVVRTAPFELQRYREQQAQYFVDEPTWTDRVRIDQRIRALVIPIDDAIEQVIQEAQADRQQ